MFCYCPFSTILSVCDRCNFVAIRLVSSSGSGGGGGGGLLRLTASASISDLDRLFSQWSDNRSLDAARTFCDLLIGCLLQLNGLPIQQSIQAVGKRLINQVPGNTCDFGANLSIIHQQ